MDDGVCSYIASASTKIPTTIPTEFRSRILKNLPHHSATFYPQHYVSDTFEITRIKHALFLPPRFIIIFGDDLRYCAAETAAITLRGAGFGFETGSVKLRFHSESLAADIEFDPSATIRMIEDDVLNIYLSPWDNYGHWHVHNFTFLEWLCSSLPSIQSAGDYARVRIIGPTIANDNLKALKQFTLNRLKALFKIDVVSEHDLKFPVQLRNLLICSSGGINRGCRWPEIYRPLLTAQRLPPSSDAPKLIYCNRSHAGRRGIDNEEALEAELLREGFFIIKAGEMSFDEQRQAFSNCRIIVGSHGASLSNMLYSHNRPHILELMHERYARVQYEWFQFLAAVAGNQYVPVIHPLTDKQNDRDYYTTDFTADIDLIITDIKKLQSIAN